MPVVTRSKGRGKNLGSGCGEEESKNLQELYSLALIPVDFGTLDRTTNNKQVNHHGETQLAIWHSSDDAYQYHNPWINYEVEEDPQPGPLSIQWTNGLEDFDDNPQAGVLSLPWINESNDLESTDDNPEGRMLSLPWINDDFDNVADNHDAEMLSLPWRNNVLENIEDNPEGGMLSLPWTNELEKDENKLQLVPSGPVVQTPGWRHLVYQPIKKQARFCRHYRQDITERESTSNRHYMKLHEQFEADEIQRKIWDRLRASQLAYHERLQQAAERRAQIKAKKAKMKAAKKRGRRKKATETTELALVPFEDPSKPPPLHADSKLLVFSFEPLFGVPKKPSLFKLPFDARAELQKRSASPTTSSNKMAVVVLKPGMKRSATATVSSSNKMAVVVFKPDGSKEYLRRSQRISKSQNKYSSAEYQLVF